MFGAFPPHCNCDAYLGSSRLHPPKKRKRSVPCVSGLGRGHAEATLTGEHGISSERWPQVSAGCQDGSRCNRCLGMGHMGHTCFHRVFPVSALAKNLDHCMSTRIDHQATPKDLRDQNTLCRQCGLNMLKHIEAPLFGPSSRRRLPSAARVR